jgi:hypothetical protein
MENLTRRKVMTTATTIAIVTIVAVIIAKTIGALIIGAFLAGAGTALTIGFVVLANIWIRQAGRNK